MKKLSIVLLALLLAGGFAVAAELDLTGEVSANFGLDFDNEEYGFYHDNTTEFGLTWTGEASSSGEGDIYAVIEWVDIELSVDTLTADVDPAEPINFSAAVGDLSAKIVGPDWEVALSSATGTSNAAAPDMDQDGDTDPEDAIDLGFDDNGGVGLTLNYMDAYVGVDFWNDADNSEDNDGTGVAEEFYAFSAGYSAELADGVTAGIDLGFDQDVFVGSVTGSYAMDMLTADAAVDFGYGVYETGNTDKVFVLDASLAVAATPVEDVTVDLGAYYEASNEDFDLFGKVAYAGIEDVELSAWGYLNDNGNADPAGTDEELEAWAFGMDASYVYDIFTPYASVGYDAGETFSLKVGTGIAIIDNAAVDVNYDNSDLANNSGAVNASVTVSL